MRVRLLLAVILAVILTGCALPQPYTDASILVERKAYVACAVAKAFSSIDARESAWEVAQAAVRDCDAQRSTVYDKLAAENAAKPDGASYAAFYLNELQAAMRSQIAARLAQARARKKTGEEAMKGEKI